MPGLRAAFRGLLKRSHSTGSSSAEPHPSQQPGQAVGSRGTSRDYGQSSPHIAALKSPSKFSVQDSIREEEDSDDNFHDAPEPASRLSTSRPPTHRNRNSTSTAPAPTSDALVNTIDLDDDDSSTPERHGTSTHSDNPPSLTLQCATPEARKPVDLLAEYVLPLPRPTRLPQADHFPPASISSPRPRSSHSSRPKSPLSVRALPSPSLPSLPLPPPPKRPSENTVRRQSLLSGANAPVIRALLSPDTVAQFPLPPSTPPATIAASDYFVDASVPNIAGMLTRKVWVKRPNASPTMVTVREDDLVDDVRDLVMRKYGNSLGRNYDSPDLVLRIVSRPDENGNRAAERMLSPDEDVCRTLDSYYAGGQTAEEALLIDTPPRRTPRPSPRIYHGASYAALDDYRPAENGTDYFPQMPAVQLPPNVPGKPPGQQTLHPEPPRSIAVLNTGQIPVLPSPGSVRRHRDPRELRPKFNRQHTSSPTIMTHNPPPTSSMPLNASNLANSQHMPTIRQGRPRAGSTVSDQQGHAIPPAPALPTPPVTEAVPPVHPGSTPPTPASQVQSTLKPARPRRQRKLTPTDGTATVKSPNAGVKTTLPPSLLDGAVPPINVLIVEDNIINLRLLEAFMKRLKVRWSTALNGQIAVNKWRAGGFHLVLMDIQMPIMNGLEATKEIRRLERANGIGVFSTAITPYTGKGKEAELKDKEDDKLAFDGGLFKSPVIIVALTASSLQSDRHEALAAGCNDFLTKVCWLHLHPKTRSILIDSPSPLISFGLNVRSRNGAACKLSSTSTAGASGRTSTLIKPQKRRRLSASHEPAPKAHHPGLLVPRPRRRTHQKKPTGMLHQQTKRRKFSNPLPTISHNAFSLEDRVLFFGWKRSMVLSLPPPLSLFLFNLVSAAHRTIRV
jgi:osomolarity two-component system response regulator SSK1